MKFVIIVFALGLTGCSTTYSGSATSTPSTTQYIRDANGIAVARISEGNVYAPNGVRTHRIDSSGNIYSTQGSNAGMRVGKIK